MIGSPIVRKFKHGEEQDYEIEDALDVRTLFIFCVAGVGANRDG